MSILKEAPSPRSYPVARFGTSIVWSSWKCVSRIPSGAKIRSAAKSRSERPLARLTTIERRKKPELL
jgi:hypothetical protein